MPELLISSEKVCAIISMARQFDNKVEQSDPDSGSNASDDAMVDVMEDSGDDAIQHELTSYIHDLNRDEKIDLVALAMLGRGDGTLAEWTRLQEDAAVSQNNRTPALLLAMPLLSDNLEEGLSLFGLSCED